MRQRERRKTPRTQFVYARSLAKRRGFEWALSEQEYTAFRSLPCHYCGFQLPQTGMGIDRMDSRLAYFVGNVVPCCTDCNAAKNANFTYEEMLILGKTIAEIKATRDANWLPGMSGPQVGRRPIHVPDITQPEFISHRRDIPAEVVQGIIHACVDENLPNGKIAERFDLYPGTVGDILRRHGIEPIPAEYPGQIGEENHNAKLTPDLVRQIRAASASGSTQHCLASQFGVSQGAIYKILSGKSWSHVV